MKLNQAVSYMVARAEFENKPSCGILDTQLSLSSIKTQKPLASATPPLIQRSFAPTSQNVLFDALRCLSRTHFLHPSSEANRCLYSNLSYKHSYFIGSLTSTHNRLPPAPLKLQLTTLWCFRNMFIIIILLFISLFCTQI